MLLLLLALLMAQPASAVEIKSSATLPAGLLNNINLHVGGIKMPTDCIVGKRLKRRLEQAIAKAIEGVAVYQYQLHSLEPIATDGESQCQQWQLELAVSPPVNIQQLDIGLYGPGAANAKLGKALAAFPLKTGMALDHQRYEQGKSDLLATANLLGFFDAQWQKSVIQIDREQNQALIHLHLATGERYQFGGLLNSLTAEDEALITGLRPFEPGEPYQSDKLNLFTQRLKRSGYFQSVFVRPVVQAANNRQVPLEVVFKFKPKNQYNLGGGFSSDTGPRARASWKRSRLNASGHSIESELFISEPEQSVGLRYRMPLSNPAQNFISLQLGWRNTHDNDTDSESLSISAKRHWLDQQADWQRVLHLRLERERFTQGSEPGQVTSLVLPGATVSRFRSDGELYPFWGDRQLLTIEAGSDSLASDIDVIKVLGQSRWLREIGRFRWFARAELGGIHTSDFEQLPASMRFFAGGDQSIRGFGYQSLSPMDELGGLSGARYLYTASTEVSVPVSEKWRIAAFADVGNASDTLFEELVSGVGAGVHWITPLGPVRLYLARGNSQLENTWRLHFALGAAL